MVAHEEVIPLETKVGFIGLGIMGMPMARNLIKAGFDLTVYNRTRSRTDGPVSAGARRADSPGDVASETDVVITMVSDTPDVEEVILGEQGVIEGIKPDAVVIDMSTISPQVTQRIADCLQERKAHMLDAPVSGGEQGAIDGTLSIMVGGEAEVYERCLPVFNAMGRSIIHVGPNAMGQTVKLMNQILVAGTLNAVVEALVFAHKSGVDLERAISVVTGGAAGSWQLANLAPRIIKRDFRPGFMIDLMQKDIGLVLEAAATKNIPLPTTSLIHQMFYALQARGEGKSGTQALVKYLESAADIEVVKPDSDQA
jgi:3-hydroxyisobutyrate dehydrogenase